MKLTRTKNLTQELLSEDEGMKKEADQKKDPSFAHIPNPEIILLDFFWKTNAFVFPMPFCIPVKVELVNAIGNDETEALSFQLRVKIIVCNLNPESLVYLKRIEILKIAITMLSLQMR